MRIQPGETVAGQPILAVRKLLKYVVRGPRGTLRDIIEQLSVDRATAEQIECVLRTEGYIEDDTFPGYNTPGWLLTPKGCALANASARKPITRQTAERLVEEFLVRVKEVNASDYAYRVSRVILFGSFLSDSPTLGDVDLSIELVDVYHNNAERQTWHRARIEAALQAGRHFGNYMQMLQWPEQEVLLKLKNRSPSLSLHYERREKVLERALPSKIIFDASSH